MDRYGKVKRWFILIVALLVITVMGITMGGRERVTFIENVIGGIVTPIQKGVYGVGSFIGDKVRPIISIWELEDENKRLTEQNEELHQQLVDALLTADEYEDLNELKEALNYVDDLRIDEYITCNVIGKDTGNWYNVFVIDKGTKHGITKHSAVMNGNGLVGLVYEVGYNWAKVVTIIDSKSSIGFEVLDSKESYDGVIHGSETSVISGELNDPLAEVNVNNIIVTSGLGLYPKGILVGRISKVDYNEDKLLTSIEVEPSVDFRNINRVFVVVKEELKND